MFSEYPLTCIFFKYRINTENGGFKPDTWLEADVRGIYPTSHTLLRGCCTRKQA